MRELLHILNLRSEPECCLKAYDGWSLSLFSGMSIEYAKPLAVFSGVSYVSCPMEFSHPEFRLATPSEREALSKVVPLEERDHIATIEAETMAGLGRHVFFIVAISAEIPGDA